MIQPYNQRTAREQLTLTLGSDAADFGGMFAAVPDEPEQEYTCLYCKQPFNAPTTPRGIHTQCPGCNRINHADTARGAQ